MFIAIDGADGTGTTTQAAKMVGTLRSRYGDDRVWQTCEPTYGPIGSVIRELLNGGAYKAENDALRYLFRADRIEHFRKEIYPRLMEGVHVVTDRFLLSTLVYQTVADIPSDLHPRKWPAVIDGMQKLWREMMNRDGLHDPDLTIVLHMDHKEASSRIDDRGEARQIYENLDFQARASRAYKMWVENGGGDMPFRYFLVDASGSVDAVGKECWTILESTGRLS